MKVMVCANLGIGELPAFDLPAGEVLAWQEEKAAFLAEALSGASAAGAEACLVAGGLFAKGFVAQSLYEACARAIAGRGLPVAYAPLPEEAADFVDRCGEVAGLDLARGGCAGSAGGVLIKDIGELDDFADFANACEDPTLLRSGSDVALACDGAVYPVAPLDSSSFSAGEACGYALVDVAEGSVSGFDWVEASAHRLQVARVSLDGARNANEVAVAAGNAVKDLDRSCCLRIELTGRLPLGVYVNVDDLAERIGRHFRYVEVVDLCSLDIDVDELGADVSLLAEFVRRVAGDDSLSETEKTRVLRCGWNVLNGKETAE